MGGIARLGSVRRLLSAGSGSKGEASGPAKDAGFRKAENRPRAGTSGLRAEIRGFFSGSRRSAEAGNTYIEIPAAKPLGKSVRFAHVETSSAAKLDSERRTGLSSQRRAVDEELRRLSVPARKGQEPAIGRHGATRSATDLQSARKAVDDLLGELESLCVPDA